MEVDLGGVLEADIILDEEGIRIESIARVEILEPISAVSLIDTQFEKEGIRRNKG